jgi:hypothetical protein
MFTGARHWIVVLCLLAIASAALIPFASGLLLVILIPLSFLSVVITGFSQCIAAEPPLPGGSPFLPVLSSRPPPSR